jgi:hypothetical protein
MRTDRIQVRVFIEGVLVPHISSVFVQTTASESSVGSISMPPAPGFELEELKRARVHIFWSDIEIRNQVAEDEWPLLFEGEIVGDSFSKHPGSRTMSFRLAGYHTYWEQVLLYFYEIQSGPQAVDNTLDIAGIVADSTSLFIGNQKLNIDSNVAGTDAVNRIASKIEEHGDEPYYSVVKLIFGESLEVNNFFRISNRALRLDSRFLTLRDPAVNRLITSQLVKTYVQNDINAMSGHVSMMEVLKRVLQLFRYQIICNAQPMFVNRFDNNLDAKRQTEEQVAADLAAVDERVQRYLIASGLTDGEAAGFVVGFDDDDDRLRELAGYVKRLVDEGVGGQTRLSDSDQLLLDVTQGRWWAGEKDVGGQPLSFDAEKLASLLIAERDEKRRISATTSLVLAELENNIDDAVEDLLSQYLIVPDTRFTLPPACNVIFPQDQTSMGLDRNLIGEKTRALSSNFKIGGVSFSKHMAPASLIDAKIPRTEFRAENPNGYHPPLVGNYRITSGYGMRQIRKKVATGKKDLSGREEYRIKDPHAENMHRGVDMVMSSGRSLGAPVHAIDDGKVVLAGLQDPRNEKVGYGNRVIMSTKSGLVAVYGHLDSVLVVAGQSVERGQVLGTLGNTGTSTGPHLHFEIRRSLRTDSDIDPTDLLRRASVGDPPRAFSMLDDPGPLAPAVTQQFVVAEEERLGDRKNDKFLDFEYLTPEEELTGINPHFDDVTARSHAIVDFGGNGEQLNDYLRQLVESEWLWQRYSQRSLQQLQLPFNANPVAGFPALIADRSRSIIGLVSTVSHTINVGGGGGNASTTVSVDGPRYWDEGDPYFWRGGYPVETRDGNGEVAPDVDFGKFPSYYNQSLIPTNSSDVDYHSPDYENINEQAREIDKFYQTALGVNGIPYQYGERETVWGTKSAYNKAIDGRDPDGRFPNTIIGRYYDLLERSPETAEAYVRSFTRRLGINERELMTLVLSATADATGYVGGPFRDGIENPVPGSNFGRYQSLVRKLVSVLSSYPAYRG